MVGLFLIAQLIGFLLLLMAFVSMLLLGLPSGSRVNPVLNLIGACLRPSMLWLTGGGPFCP